MSDTTQHRQPKEALESPPSAADQSPSDRVFDQIEDELSARKPMPAASFFDGQSMEPFDSHDPLFALLGAFGDPNGPKTNIAGNKHEYLDDSHGDGER